MIRAFVLQLYRDFFFFWLTLAKQMYLRSVANIGYRNLYTIPM
jgi:hypothetical protein